MISHFHLFQQDLRKELDKLLESKIEKPGATEWSSASTEGRIMKAITDLLSTRGGEEDDRDEETPPAEKKKDQHYRHDRYQNWRN